MSIQSDLDRAMSPKTSQAKAQRDSDRPYLWFLIGWSVFLFLSGIAIGLAGGWAQWAWLPQM